MKIGAVIVAAGMSSRMDKDKRLMKIGNMTLAERVVINFQRVGVKDIAVVTGCQAEQVEKALHRFGVVFLRNENYKTTKMLDSVKIGLEYLGSRCDRIFVCPVDVPFFTEQTMRMLLNQTGKVVFPCYKGRGGHPVCFEAALVPSILAYQGDGGLRGALDSLGVDPVKVQVDDEGVVTDVDTPEDYRRLLKLHEARLLRPQVKVRLANHRPFFGPGTVTLLKQIDRIESVREACGRMGISYSKGWTIIRTAEEELGYKIVERQPGGKNGGAAYVTQRGKKLLHLYERYEEQVETVAQELFHNIFLESDLF